jgi:hypothetical protein
MDCKITTKDEKTIDTVSARNWRVIVEVGSKNRFLP